MDVSIFFDLAGQIFAISMIVIVIYTIIKHFNANKADKVNNADE